MPASIFGRRHFVLDKQRAFIRGHGVSAIIVPVVQCPCLSEDRQFAPLCRGCHGSGAYYPPGQSYSTTLLIQHEDSRREFYDPGTWTAGTILATVMPGVRLSERDKVRLLDLRDSYTDEVLIRGVDDAVRFSAGVVLQLVADLDRVYRPDLDYVLTPPSTVTWVAGGQAPPLNGQYSVKYEAIVEYRVCADSPRLRVEGRRGQAQEVRLQRLDMLSEEG